MSSVAVIGAGLAGLACGRALAAGGVDVVVWEKSRGPGGRAATRRTEQGEYDHGCPKVEDRAIADGLDVELVVLPGVPGFVPAGSMSALSRALGAGLDQRSGTRVTRLQRDGDGVALHGDHERSGELGDAPARPAEALGRFDAVVVTAPAPQAAVLMGTVAPALAERAARVAFDPCWAVLAAFGHRLDRPDVLPGFGAVRWAARQSALPGRAPGERWVIQAVSAWSRAHLEDEPERVLDALLPASVSVVAATAHRWRHAWPRDPLGDLVLRDGPIVAAGDWLEPRGDAAGAVRSGRAAAAALLGA